VEALWANRGAGSANSGTVSLVAVAIITCGASVTTKARVAFEDSGAPPADVNSQLALRIFSCAGHISYHSFISFLGLEGGPECLESALLCSFRVLYSRPHFRMLLQESSAIAKTKIL
jgi:hypothetical protein